MPDMEDVRRNAAIADWNKAVRCAYGWAKEI